MNYTAPAFAFFLALTASSVQGQSIPAGAPLPTPTGPFAVGRREFALTDSTRAYPPASEQPRRVMVYLWYPARATAAARPAAYIPGLARIQAVLGDSAMGAEFRSAYQRVAAHGIESPVYEGPAPAHAPTRFPFLFFSHGFGESSLTYTTILSDLASHGYVIAALEHPGEAYAVLYPDGQVSPFDQAAWDSALSVPHGAATYQLAQVPLMAEDLLLTLRALTTKPWPQMRDILRVTNTRRVGVLGHSLGGLAAAETCRIVNEIRACLNIDAEFQGVPWIDATRKGPTQTFGFLATPHSLYVTRYTTPPTAEALAGDGLSRETYDSIMKARQRRQDDALASVGRGAYRVTFEGPAFTHRSFLDLDLLGATDETSARRAGANLRLASRYIRAFFDLTLKDQTATALGEEPPDSLKVGIRHWSGRELTSH